MKINKVIPKDIRCPNCNKKAGEAVGETHIKVVCSKCKNAFEHTTKNNSNNEIWIY